MRRGMKPGAVHKMRPGDSRGRIAAWTVVLAAAVSVPIVPRPLAAASPDPVARLREAWRGQKSLTVRFVQTQTFAGFDDPLESNGTLTILRPSYFDLRYDPPSRQRQICDGAYVWTYDPDQKQVVKTPLAPEATRSADLLDWALEGASLLSSTPDESMGKGGTRLEVQPGGQLPLVELRVWMREADARLLGYEEVDGDGNRMRMRLLDIRPAKGLKPSDFSFQPPAGVEVIEMGGER